MENFNTHGTENTINNNENKKQKNIFIIKELLDSKDDDHLWDLLVSLPIIRHRMVDALIKHATTEFMDKQKQMIFNYYRFDNKEYNPNHKYYIIRRERNKKRSYEMDLKYPDEYVNGSDVIHFIYNEYYNHLIAVIHYHDNDEVGYIAIKDLQNFDVVEQVHEFLYSLLSDKNIFYNGRSDVIHVCIQTTQYEYCDTFEYLDIKLYESDLILNGVSKIKGSEKNGVVEYEDVVAALRLIRDSNYNDMTLDVWE